MSATAAPPIPVRVRYYSNRWPLLGSAVGISVYVAYVGGDAVYTGPELPDLEAWLDAAYGAAGWRYSLEGTP